MDHEELLKNLIKNAVAELKHSFRTILQETVSQKEATNQDAAPYLSAEGAATFLRITVNTLYSKVQKGELPHYHSGKRKLLFSKKELEDYVRKRKGAINDSVDEEIQSYLKKKK